MGKVGTAGTGKPGIARISTSTGDPGRAMVKPGRVGKVGKAGKGGMGTAIDRTSVGSPGRSMVNPGGVGSTGNAGSGGIGIAIDSVRSGNEQFVGTGSQNLTGEGQRLPCRRQQ